jgi:hypothetical protein
MSRFSGMTLRPLLLSLLLGCSSSTYNLYAQPKAVPVNKATPDAFQVHYAANLLDVESVVNITNTGASGGNLCINIYTFDAAEELQSCCSCTVTPNGLVSLGITHALLMNTLTGEAINSAVVDLIATAETSGSACNPSAVSASNLAAGMRAWSTTVHVLSKAPGRFSITETPFSMSVLSAGGLASVSAFCGFIQANGSHYGICYGCETGGLGAAADR